LHVKLPTPFCRIFLIRPNSATISSGAFCKYDYSNKYPSILLHSLPTQILLPGESTMGIPLATLPPLHVVKAML